MLDFDKVPYDANVIGFDVGTRRVGVALANRTIGAARPLAILPARPFPWERVAEWIEEWQPAYVVIGWPVPSHVNNPSNNQTSPAVQTDVETTVMRRARGLANVLDERFGLSSVFQDERLTSQAAADRRRDTSRSPRPRGSREHGPIDAEAAAIILDDHLRDAMGRGAKPQRIRSSLNPRGSLPSIDN
ncbi:MAG: Holliday junction resolvase RuvX [Thioalkalivibrionaceae bacterium]